MIYVSKICLYLFCCDVLTIVCFKEKLRYVFYYVKQLSRIDFRGTLFTQNPKQGDELWTVLRFLSASQFYVVVAFLF